MMLRLLVILGLGLYSVMLIGGEDKGQLRAGLRDVPEPEKPAPAPVAIEAAAPSEAPERVAAITLASLPAQPIRVLPPPPRSEAPAGEVTAADAGPVAEEADPETLANTKLAWVTANRANVRQAPSRQASVAGRVERGEALLVLWREPSGWVRVRVEGDGVDGFVHESLLTDTAPSQ